MITVLRIGHRPSRDKRITTHVALVARAFSAENIIIDTKDEKLKDTIDSVTNRFGGSFNIKTGINWRKYIKNWSGKVIHLTMYGEHVDDILEEVGKNDDLLIVVGSEKVSREVFELADLNIAVGHQPHSEVAALAIFLDRIFTGSELRIDFKGKLRVIGQPKGKLVIENDGEK